MANRNKTKRVLRARKGDVRLGVKECRNGNASGFQLIASNYAENLGVTEAEFQKWKAEWETLQKEAFIKKGTPGTIVFAHVGHEYGIVCALDEADRNLVYVQFIESTGSSREGKWIDELDVENTISPKMQWDPPEEVLAMAAS